MAYSPLLRGGLLASDYAQLLAPGKGSPSAGAWLVSLVSEAPPDPGSGALPFRLGHLLGLAALVIAMRVFLARLLLPWIGLEAAGASATTAALLLPLHPSATSIVAELGARAELVAVALALGSGALFLVGRQEEREGFTIASLATLIAAGLFSAVAVPWAFFFGLAEFGTVRRHRRRTLRARTALTTLAVFGAGSWLGVLAGGSGSLARQALFHGVPDFRARIQAMGDVLGRLVLPGSPGMGAWSAVLAGGLLLASFQPAFVAARHAPRLWSGLFLVWGPTLVLGLVWSTAGGSGGDLLALLAWTAGLGLAVSSLGSSQRVARVALVMAGFGVLAHATARPRLRAAGEQARVLGELHALTVDSGAPVLLIDPPTLPGFPRMWNDLGWMLHPRLTRGSPAGDGEFDPLRVRALSTAAFLAFIGTKPFSDLRPRHPLAVVREPTNNVLRAVRLGPGGETPGTLQWRHDLSFTPAEPLDPLDWDFVRIVAGLSSAPRDLETLAWVTPAGTPGSVRGNLGEQGLRRTSDFDLSSSLAWRLSVRVRSLAIEKGVRNIERGEVLASVPGLPGVGAPIPDGDDWLFLAPEPGTPHAPDSNFTLSLLAHPDLELLSVPVGEESPGRLRAPGARLFAQRKQWSGSSISWTLDYRSGSRVLLRARGHLP